MNLTIVTTLLALLVSSAITTTVNAHAQVVDDVHPTADARHLRVFGRRPAAGGGSAPAPAPGPAPVPAVKPSNGRGVSFGQAVDGAVASLELTAAVLPLIPAPSSNNACRQVACWIATSSEACGTAAANKVQADVMRGRDAFAVEGTGPSGMWVRYWRTQFMPANQDTVAQGACDGGATFTVTNCQPAGEVKC